MVKPELKFSYQTSMYRQRTILHNGYFTFTQQELDSFVFLDAPMECGISQVKDQNCHSNDPATVLTMPDP